MKTNNGIILLNKPQSYTSRDIVNIVSKKLKTKKVGHTGTLDPLATGLLVICYGKYTKLVNYLTMTTKTYLAEIKLGIKTDTLDITGKVLETKHVSLEEDQIKKVLNSFLGVYHMEVPIYSAVKVNGKKLYEYARSGLSITLPTKDVKIYAIDFLSYHDDIITFSVTVEKGTYIRSLIKDICLKLHTIGTMSNLIRIKQGPFNLEDACSLEDFQNNNYQVLNIRDVLPLKEYPLTEALASKVLNGNKLTLPETSEYLLFTQDNEDIALYKKEANTYCCSIMF